MAEVLFITPEEITATTILGGSVDPDRYVMNIAFAQIDVIEPLLGTELFDKITADFIADTLSGDYLTLFNEYVKPITKHEALGKYIENGQLLVENGGIFKHVADNRESASESEVKNLASDYKHMAQMYIKRFEKWICKHQLTEYKRYQDDVNAQNVDVKGGFYFGKNYDRLKSIDDYIADDLLNE